jgi:hypothetical protein
VGGHIEYRVVAVQDALDKGIASKGWPPVDQQIEETWKKLERQLSEPENDGQGT